MSENKFYRPTIDPFDNKRGKLHQYDASCIFRGIEKLELDKTIINPKLNNFLICTYLDICEFKIKEDIPLNKDLKYFCTKNNIKIIVWFSREYLHPGRRFISDEYYMMQNVDNNREDTIGLSFFDHAYSANRFHDVEFKDNIEKTKKFSIVLGLLNKTSRMWWCVKLIHENLHNHPDILFSKLHTPIDAVPWTLDHINTEVEYTFKDEKYLIDTLFKNKGYIQEDTFIEENMSVKKLYNKGAEWNIPEEFYSTLINVVFETRPYHWSYGSLTEKMWKPIMAGLPFIWISFQNTKPYLENMGYKFHDFIDYSFDSIEEYETRFRAVYTEFERLNSFSFDELKSMVDNEKHITEHNKNIFFNTDYDKRLMDVFSSIK